MEKYYPRIGDIILSDGNHTGAKIVKFFMTAPTIWHYIWRAITRKQEKVNYYHVAMIISDGFSGFTGLANIIEQQKKVQFEDWNQNKKQVIFRLKNLTHDEKIYLHDTSIDDIGKKWDLLNAIGKFLTWLTGIKLFARYVEYPNAEICVNRVAKWYFGIGEKFGAKKHSELTTQDMYKYMINNDNYEIVY